MTTAEAHHLAQQNPVLTLTARLGELKQQADREVANLEQTLRHLDETRAQLDEHGITMTVDLGAVGNAAAHARTAALADKGKAVFALPTGAAA